MIDREAALNFVAQVQADLARLTLDHDGASQDHDPDLSGTRQSSVLGMTEEESRAVAELELQLLQARRERAEAASQLESAAQEISDGAQKLQQTRLELTDLAAQLGEAREQLAAQHRQLTEARQEVQRLLSVATQLEASRQRIRPSRSGIRNPLVSDQVSNLLSGTRGFTADHVARSDRANDLRANTAASRSTSWSARTATSHDSWLAAERIWRFLDLSSPGIVPRPAASDAWLEPRTTAFGLLPDHPSWSRRLHGSHYIIIVLKDDNNEFLPETFDLRLPGSDWRALLESPGD